MRNIYERRFIQESVCYCDVYVPDKNHPTPLIIGFHGYGGDKASMMRKLQLINKHDFALASIQGAHQHIKVPDELNEGYGYGFSWITSFHPQESIARHHMQLIAS